MTDNNRTLRKQVIRKTPKVINRSGNVDYFEPPCRSRNEGANAVEILSTPEHQPEDSHSKFAMRRRCFRCENMRNIAVGNIPRSNYLDLG